MHKKALYVVRRIVGYTFLAIYLIIAALNSTVVQSYIGAAVGNYFSKEWGGKVRIGALHASPISHVILEDIELISPTNDTIYYGERIACRFKRFPFHGDGLSFDRVSLRNGRYHLHCFHYPSGESGINLDYIINYFASGATPSESTGAVFTVDVGELRLRNIDYIQDLPESPTYHRYDHGVDIPHMRFYNISGYFRNVHVENDHVTVRIVSLTTTEASGQHIVDLSMDAEVGPNGIRATNMDLQTDDSRVFLDARLDYNGWEQMSDYCNTVHHDVVLKEGTEVNLCDAAYWAPTLWGMNCKVQAQGHIFGPVADMTAEHFIAAFGQSSQLFLDASITGLPDINHTTINADIHRLHTNYDDLAAVQHPEPITMKAPDIIRRMAVIDLNASLNGGLRDCEAYFNLNSLIGDLEGHALLHFDTVLNQYAYLGDLDSRTIGIRSILPNEWVSRTGFHLSFQGTGFDPATMEASIQGRLYNTQIKGNNIERTTLSAELAGQELTADITLKDTRCDLDLTATAGLGDSKSLSADIILDHAQLTALHLIDSDTDITLTTRLVADLEGDDLDHLTGTLSLHNTRCDIGSRHIALRNVMLQASEQNGFHNLSLGSDWASMNIGGYFSYTDLPLVVRDFCQRFLPTYYNPYRNLEPADLSPLHRDHFTIDLVWNDAHGTFNQFMPQLDIADSTVLQGNYNYGESLKLVLTSDSLTFGNIALHDIGLNGNTLGENYRLRLRAASLHTGASTVVGNLDLNAAIGSVISTLALQWSNPATGIQTGGDIEMFLTSSPTDNRIMVTRPDFHIMGQRWSLVCPDGIYFNNDRLQIDNLKIYGIGQGVTLNAHMAGTDQDIATATFNNFSIGPLAALLIDGNSLDLRGTLNGLCQLKGLSTNPHMGADLTIKECLVNGHPLGDIDINTAYLPDDARLNIDIVSTLQQGLATSYPIEAHGHILTRRPNPSLLLDLSLNRLPLPAVKPLLATIATDLQGSLNGSIHAEGPLSQPNLDGSLAIRDALIKLTPTGVTYHVNDTLTLNQNALSLNGLTVRDDEGNQAQLGGDITIGQQGLALNLTLRTPRLLMLNKPVDGSAFYGKLIGSATGTVTGPLSQLQIAAEATALQGSDIYVPISNHRQVSENEYIVFYAPDLPPQPRQTPRTGPASNNNLNLQANVKVTPGVTVHLPMDFDQLTANVTAVGNGDIQVTMRGGEPNILGDYVFTSGNFSLSLLQVLNKNFAIEEGSTLNFPGNINDARFNLSAVYNQRVNLATLMGSTSDTYVQVQDIINLSGTLQDPTIKFDIQLPNAEQSVTDQVFSYIDRTNERDMLNQSLSLLLLGRFTPTGTAGAADNILSDGSSINLLTSSASSLVSNLVKVVDVNFKYQAGSGTAPGQFDVGISKQWNKFYFESTFGYGNANTEIENSYSNVLVGDVEMGYKFNPYLNLFGFHRNNTSYYTRTELPYKQGLGIKLTKDFNTIHDLFPWLRRKEKTVK